MKIFFIPMRLWGNSEVPLSTAMLTETCSAGKHCMKQLGLDDSGFVNKLTNTS
jgi:hypothetical protein